MTKTWTVLVTAPLVTLLALLAPMPVARADIFEWEYINPANPSQGKHPSTTLAPDGAGVDAVPGAVLMDRNLTKAYLIGADLTNAYAPGANLSDAELSKANLTNANFGSGDYGFQYVNLTGANFTDAEVRGANFGESNLTVAQLTSTASYQAHDLTGIKLYMNSLSGVDFSGQNLSGAELVHATLTNADFSQANLTNANLLFASLTNANFTQANFTDASLNKAVITGANLNDAVVRGADFDGSGITAAQLISTASYQARDLRDINLSNNDMTGVNLAAQNLTNASFLSTTLTGANLTGTEVRGADFGRHDQWNPISPGVGGISIAQLYSTSSYQAHDLTEINLDGNNLSGANLASQNLTRANFYGATLTNADFHQANLSNASFSYGVFPPFGLPPTNLIGANLSHANLTRARFNGGNECLGDFCWDFEGANLIDANLSGADARHANFYYARMVNTNTQNMIRPDGHIAGLDLRASEMLIVRDYDHYPPPIVVDQNLAMDATGTLRLVFDADPWDSKISFALGIPVALGGTLELTFASGVDIASQSGRTIDLFDWDGVTPTGAFTVSSPYTWNLTNLYTTGEVTLAAAPSLPGDFNLDGTVDAADYVVWRKNPGGIYSQNDYTIWRAHFGQPSGSGSGASANATVPEPATFMLLIVAAVGFGLQRRLLVWQVLKTHWAGHTLTIHPFG
jgi:uncharacterized protein YjbI with pentapeptide repeats